MPFESFEIDPKAPPFDQYRAIRPLATNRAGREAAAHTRHQLYVARQRVTSAQVLIKVTTRPGLVYERNLQNEIESLTRINAALPDTRYFPLVLEHGRLRDGRIYLVTTLFDEFPLATAVDEDRMPARMAGHMRTTIEVARALALLHGLPIYHVDLNPMNILFRTERGEPIVRIVDFESSYDPARHVRGTFYDPPTTPHFSAPEVSTQRPDARADIFSLGAVLYTLLAGYGWTWSGEAAGAVDVDADLDPDLKDILRRAVCADREARYPTVEAFRGALVEYAEKVWPGRGWA
ncbi:MAG: protein kinase [Acidobacteria bacterium]|nr:protein kinase [Acidobacteriota bacterium]